MSQQINSTMPAEDEESDFHLLDLILVLARYRWLILSSSALSGFAALVISLIMAPSFSSTVKVLPPQQPQNAGMAAVLGQLGGLAGVAGSAGLKSSSDLYIALLESRTVADNLIGRFKLKERYQKPTMDETRRALADASVIASGKKDGMISITFSDKDAAFAATVANAYADELAMMTQTMALTEASQRRMFFEKQLKDARDQLAEAEIGLRTTQEKTGLIQPEAQVQAIITNLAQLKGTIAAKEVQLNGMRTFASKQNPELLRTEEELRGLRTQLSKLEQTRAGKGTDFMVPTGKIPEVAVEYTRRLRDVKYYETIFELLAKQFELAKIDEAKDSTSVQVLDKAIPAERKSKPNRALMTVGGLMFGLVAGIVLAFMRSTYLSSRAYPASRERWEKLSSTLRPRRVAKS